MSGAFGPVNVEVINKVDPTIVNSLRAISQSAREAGNSIAVLNEEALRSTNATARLTNSQARLLQAQTNATKATQQATQSLRNVGHATNLASGYTTRFKTELIVLAHELSQGRYTRFAGSLMVLAEAGNVANAIFSPLGFTILAVGGALAAFGLSAQHSASQMATFNNELTATGGYAGKTAQGFKELAQQLAGETNSRLGATNEVLNKLILSGRVTGDTLRYIAASSLILAKETGEDAAKFAKDFADMGENVVQFAIKFNDQYHVLNAAQVSYIRQLQQQGETEKAQQIASEQIYKALASRAGEQLTWLGRRWQDLGVIIDGIGEKIDRIVNGSSISQKIAEIKADIASRSNSPLGQSGGLFGTPVSELQGQLAVLQKQLDAENHAAAAKAEYNRQQQIAIHAEQDLVSEFEPFNKGAERAVDVIRRLHVEMEKIRAVNPNSPKLKEFEANIAAIEARIRKRYDPVGTKEGAKAERLEESRIHLIDIENQKLIDQINTFGLLGQAKEEQAQIDRINLELKRRKVDELDPKEEAGMRQQIETAIQLKAIQQQLESVYNANQGAIITLSNEYAANSIALQAHIITLTQYENKMREIGLAFLELKLKANDATFAEGITVALGRTVQEFHSLSQSLTDDFTTFFQTIEDGVANTFGKVLTGQESLRDAVHQFATQGLSELISGLVKMGEQYLLTQVLGQTLGAAATASSGAQAAALAAAWAEPAALASLATLGANAIPATAALASTSAVAAALAAAGGGLGFADGGLFRGRGGDRTDSNVIRISDNEFITNARQTRKYLPLLEAINNDNLPRSVGTPTPYFPQQSQGGSMRVSVYNYAGVKVETRQLSRNEVAVMIREQAPVAVAAHIADPNSRVSKTISRNVDAKRKRQ